MGWYAPLPTSLFHGCPASLLWLWLKRKAEVTFEPKSLEFTFAREMVAQKLFSSSRGLELQLMLDFLICFYKFLIVWDGIKLCRGYNRMPVILMILHCFTGERWMINPFKCKSAEMLAISLQGHVLLLAYYLTAMLELKYYIWNIFSSVFC